MAGKSKDDLDALLDETGIALCGSYLHKAPEEVQPLLRRARERVIAGERISPVGLAQVIQREFDVHIDSRRIAHYIRTGCNCEQ